MMVSTTTQLAPVGARSALQGRILIGSGATLPSVDALTVPHLGGLKAAGSSAAKHIGQLARFGVDFPMILDLDACVELEASAQAPFLVQSDTLFPETLSSRLDEVRQVGATVAFTPTGYIPPGNEAVETAVQRVNNLERDDLVLSLPLDAGWLVEEALFERLMRQIDECQHVVSISLVHERDPLSEPGVGERLRRLAALERAPFLDRADLVGMDYLVHGGLGACIGIGTPHRHGQSPTIKGRPYFAKDGRASVLVPKLARFMRPTKLDDLYPSGLGAPSCGCPFCEGSPLTSFTQKRTSQQRARNHNAWWIQNLTEQVLEDPAGRPPIAAWRDLVLRAIEEHERVRVDLSRPNFSIPRSFEHWAW